MLKWIINFSVKIDIRTLNTFRKLFKANKNLTKPHEISESLREGEARLAMATHYRNPYPRPVNLPPRSYAKREGKKLGRAIDKLNQISKPIYVRSIDDSKQWKILAKILSVK